MFLKAAVLALALVAAWIFLRRSSSVGVGSDGSDGGNGGNGGARRNRRELQDAKPQDMEACPRCGVFHLRGQPCDCDRSPTSGE